MADSENEVCSELIRLLRVQRHDFINHMQVVHAMLQLGRTEKAMDYIENLSKDPALVTDSLHTHVTQANCQRRA
jgi:sensor histidine kinase regulating citrate/malate metabolism